MLNQYAVRKYHLIELHFSLKLLVRISLIYNVEMKNTYTEPQKNTTVGETHIIRIRPIEMINNDFILFYWYLTYIMCKYHKKYINK